MLRDDRPDDRVLRDREDLRVQARLEAHAARELRERRQHDRLARVIDDERRRLDAARAARNREHRMQVTF